jgi:hypothetical protein
MADHCRCQHGIWTRLRKINLAFSKLLTRATLVHISIHAAGFAILSLAPVMDLDALS